MDQADEIPGGDGRRTGAPGRDRPPPRTDQIRIAAVEAAVAAGWSEAPAVDDGADGSGSETASDAPGEGAPAASETDAEDDFGLPPLPELPDWVDPPTGQVPRVLLDSANGDGSVGGLVGPRGPTWREQAEDWDDDLGLGAIEEAADDTTGVAGRAVEDPFLEGPIDFAELDDDPRRAAAGLAAAGSGARSDPGPPASAPGELVSEPAESVEDDLAAEEAFAAFAAAERSEPGPGRHRQQRDQGEGGHRRVGRRGSENRPVVTTSTLAADASRPEQRAPASGARRPERAVAVGSTEVKAGQDRSSSARNPLVATLTGVVAGAVVLACFLGGAVPALTLVTVVATLAAGEAFGTLRRAGRRPAAVVGLVGVPALVVGSYLRGPIALPVVLACCVVVAAIWYLAQATEPPGSPGVSASPASDLGATLLVLVWVGALAAFGGLLLAPARFPDRNGVAYLFAAIVLTVAHDVGSYAAGATLGRHRVLPAVSPNKTWEGLAGGTVVTFAAAIGVSHIHPIAAGTAVGLAALVCVLAPLGDLTESLVKRDLGVKDMGRVLPAHGGFFDRIDAILFVLPAAYFLFRVAHPS